MSVSLQYGGVLHQSKQKIGQNNSRPKSSKSNHSNINFGRALTSDEANFLHLAMERVHQINGVQERTVIIPDAANSGYSMTDKNGKLLKVDTGVGSPFSKEAQERILYLKKTHGINAVQDLPKGGILPDKHKFTDPNVFYQTLQNLSPKDGSSFETGTHLIDPGLMYEQGLVSAQDIEKYNINQIFNFKTENDYANYFEKEDTFFKKAFENFKRLGEDSELKKSYTEFLKKPIGVELEKNAVLNTLTENLYGQSNYLKWHEKLPKANSASQLEMNPELDKKLYFALNDASHQDHEIAKARLQAIKQDATCRESMDFFMFKQFLANNQAQRRYDFLHKNGIKVIAEVSMRTNLADTYGNPEAFNSILNPNGGPSDLGKPVNLLDPAGVPALKNNAAAANFMAKKYEVALETADTAYIGPDWKLRFSEKAHDYYDEETGKWTDNGHKFWTKIKSVFTEKGKELPFIDDADKNNPLQMEIATESGLRKIKIGEYDSNPSDILTIGGYDRPAIISHIHDREDQINEFAKLYQGLHENGAKGAQQTQITFVDLFGGDNFIHNTDIDRNIHNLSSSSETEQAAKRIANLNNPNWKTRIANAWETILFKNLAGDNPSGTKTGLNAPKVANRTLYWKNIIGNGAQAGEIANHSSIKDAPIVAELLQYWENILEEKGVYTSKEANVQSEKLMGGFYEKFGRKAAEILRDGYNTLTQKITNDSEDNPLEELMLNFETAAKEHKKNFVAPIIESDYSNQTIIKAPQTASNTAESIVENMAKNTADNAKNPPIKKFNYTKAGIIAAAGLAVAGGLAKWYMSKDDYKAPKNLNFKHQERKNTEPKKQIK